MLKCKDVSRIVSSDQRVNLLTRLEIHFHLFICKHCHKFYKQIQILKLASKKFISITSDQIDESKIAQIENKIIDQAKNRGHLE